MHNDRIHFWYRIKTKSNEFINDLTQKRAYLEEYKERRTSNCKSADFNFARAQKGTGYLQKNSVVLSAVCTLCVCCSPMTELRSHFGLVVFFAFRRRKGSFIKACKMTSCQYTNNSAGNTIHYNHKIYFCSRFVVCFLCTTFQFFPSFSYFSCKCRVRRNFSR